MKRKQMIEEIAIMLKYLDMKSLKAIYNVLKEMYRG